MMNEAELENTRIDYIERMPDSDFKDFWRAVRSDVENESINFFDQQFGLNAVEHFPTDLDLFVGPFGRDIPTQNLRQAFKRIAIYQKMTRDFGVKIDDAILDRLIEARRSNQESTSQDKLDSLAGLLEARLPEED